MGNVITFENGKRKKKTFNPNKEKSKMATEKATSEGSSTDVDYAKLEPEQQIEYWKNLEKEEEERFKEKYKNVLAAVPGSAGEKMQYFAIVMFKLLPDTFHGSWDARFDTWMDFSQFYITGFDSAYSDYINANKRLERPYQYKFGAMAAEKLEDELVDCLGKIIELCPEKKEEDKTEMLYQAARLFELQDLLSDLFYKEVTKD